MTRGLSKVGYHYVNIDDCWQVSRNATGYIESDPVKFPDMRGLADYVHSKGLLFGVYSSAGTNTCQGTCVRACVCMRACVCVRVCVCVLLCWFDSR